MNRFIITSKLWGAVLVIILAFMPIASSMAALTATAPTQITFLENGWYGEGFAIHIIPGTGVTGCPVPEYEFGIAKSHPAYKDMLGLAMMAYASGSKVQLVVDTGVCVLGNRTNVISIRLYK